MSAPEPFDPTSTALERYGALDDAQRACLRTQIGVTDEPGLAWAVAANRVRDTEALGPDLQKTLRRALRTTPWQSPWRHIAHARDTAERVFGWLQQNDAALRLVVVGAVRRMDPWVECVDLLATAHDPEALRHAFETLGVVDRVVAPGDVRLSDGTRVTLTVCAEDPQAFHSALENLVEPWPRALDAPSTVTMANIRGLAHVHTNAAAGSHAVRALADEARGLGYHWMVIADRSPTAAPRGLDLDQLEAQHDVIQAARDASVMDAAAMASEDATPEAPTQPPLTIFHSLEVRAGPDGTLDVPDAALAAIDFGIGVVEDAPGAAAGTRGASPTDRACLLTAHPSIRVLGHPRRASLGGPGLAYDLDRLLPALRANNVALEISGAPDAQPLPASWHAAVRAAGIRVLPAANAHDLRGFDGALAAVGTLRPHGYTVSEVVGTLGPKAMRAFVRGEDA